MIMYFLFFPAQKINRHNHVGASFGFPEKSVHVFL